MSQNPANINIYLEKSKNATEFYDDKKAKTEPNVSTESLLHIKEYHRVLRLIGNLVAQTNDGTAKDNMHNSITVLGTRGSGKSSFLLTVRKAIKNGEYIHSTAKASDIQLLDKIDPTLVEEKGHIFLYLISTITTLVEGELTQIECDPARKHSAHKKHDWKKVLSSLANGLPSIDGIGANNTDRWEDAQFVMDNGLIAVNSARNLTTNFNKFLAISLEILNKKVFLATFDDIDVDSSKGWAVLETIRKYLSGSRLITILSGDMKLFSTTIRSKKWRNIGHDIIEYEGIQLPKQDDNNPGIKGFNDIVTELTSQYMLKVMQPEFRVHLTSLFEKKSISKDLKIIVKDFYASNDDGFKDEEIDELYTKIFKKYGICNVTQVEVYKTFMLGLPLRSQIQFLLLMKNPEPVDHVKGSITDIFMADLYEKSIDVTLAQSTPKYLSAITMKLLLQERRLFDLYQLQPNTTDGSLNGSLLSLSMLFANSIKEGKLFLIFDYILRVGYVRNLNSILPNAEIQSGVTAENQPNINELCRKSGIYNDNILRDVTGHMIGYLYGSISNKSNGQEITHSFIGLLALHGKLKKNAKGNKLDEVFSLDNNKGHLLKNVLGFTPSFSLVYNYKAGTKVCYSVFILIAAIGEIIKRVETVTGSNDDLNTQKIIIKNALKELSQFRAYPVTEFSGKSLGDISNPDPESGDSLSDDDDAPRQDQTEGNEDWDNMAENISKWLSLSNDKKPLNTSPHLLGKIITRFYNALTNIQDRRNNQFLLGELFSVQITAFMNAVLVEDIKENVIEALNISLNNVFSTESMLIDNLRVYLKAEEKANIKNKGTEPRAEFPIGNVKLSKWILACPLLLPYLNFNDDLTDVPEKTLRVVLKDYCKGYMSEDFDKISIVTELNKVEISGSTSDESEYIILDITEERARQLLEDPVQLAELLKTQGYPFWWFNEKINRPYTANSNIKKYLNKIFGITPRSLSSVTRKFRRQLVELNITW